MASNLPPANGKTTYCKATSLPKGEVWFTCRQRIESGAPCDWSMSWILARLSLVTVSNQRRPTQAWQPKAAKVSRPVDTSSITPWEFMTKVTSDTTPNSWEKVDGSRGGSFIV
jgi:hypothetical protein